MTAYLTSPVPPAGLPVVWKAVKAWLERYPNTWSQFETLESIELGIRNGFFQLWTTIQDDRVVFALLMQEIHFENAKVLRLVWAAGTEIEKYAPMVIAEIDQEAGRRGMDYIQVIGRSGWERFLAPYGYEKQYTILGKAVAPHTQRHKN